MADLASELAKMRNPLGVLFAGHPPQLIDEADPVDPEVLEQLQAPADSPPPAAAKLTLSPATRARIRGAN